MPVLADAGIQLFFNGPESFTPDDRYLLGETPEVRDLFVATGFNSIGILSAGGVGKVAGGLDPRPATRRWTWRTSTSGGCMPFQANRRYLQDRTTETLGLLYAMHWPYRQYATARGVRRTPFHDRLVAAGACMGETAGWERPNWYSRRRARRRGTNTRYGRQNWFDACRRRMPPPSATPWRCSTRRCFAKFVVEGRDACAVLNRICGRRRRRGTVGRVVYTQWLNDRAGIEADLTVTRLAEREFLVVTVGHLPDTRPGLAEAGNSRRSADAHCSVTDVTSGLAMLGLMGPAAATCCSSVSGRRPLERCASRSALARDRDRLCPRACEPHHLCRRTRLGAVPAGRALPRTSSTRLLAAGAPFGLTHAGYHAMNACRIEKGYRHWGHDIGDEDTPLDAGLGFAVAWDKPGGFVGREALLSQKTAGPLQRRLVQVMLDDASDTAPLLYHEEPIVRDGMIVGSIRSGAWGHRLDRSIGMGYVSCDDGVAAEWLASGRWEVEVACRRHSCRVQLQPWYDPRNERIRS